MRKPFPWRLFALIFLTASFLAFLDPKTIQADGAAKVGRLRVTGIKRFTEPQVTAASGIKSGQAFDKNALDAAMEKLGKTGAFQEVAYSYVPSAGKVDIEFKVEEAAKFRPCLFDNFVWASDEELQAWLRQNVSLYIREAPETGALLDEIAQSLEALSKEKGVTAQVERRIQQGFIGDPNWSHLFHALSPKVTIQRVNFTGNAAVSSKDLEDAAARLIGREYSNVSGKLFGNTTLASIYLERGYLRASLTLQAPHVLSAGSESAPDFAVDTSYLVKEGGAYRWLPAEWTGNQVFAGSQLEGLMRMKPEEIAGTKKTDEGWEAIRQEYKKKGYVQENLTLAPQFDDATLHVRYSVAVKEGPQFHMGMLTIVGVPPNGADQLTSKWKLRPGDVFDGSYPEEFMSKFAGPLLQGVMKRRFKMGWKLKLNADRTADVEIHVE